MAVLSYREVIPRTYEHKIGGSPTATRNFVVTVDEPTAHADILAAAGVSIGSLHPEHPGLTCESVSVDEPDRHHATVSASYAVPEPGDDEDPDQPPWLQPDVWTFSTSSGSVACTYHYPVAGNNVDTKVLANAAEDPITGITRPETELKMTISGARRFVSLPELNRLANTINRFEWLGFPPRTVLCSGISATPDTLEFQGQVLKFWRQNIELIYRPSSHDLFLPNVGWHVIVNGKKERAWTYISVDGVREKVPSPEKVSLNLHGGFLCGQEQNGASDPDGGTYIPGG